MSSDIYYFDHAAATPVDKRVLDAMLPFFSDAFFNPSSPYAPAVKVRRDYEAAKARLAHTFGAKADEIIMTAGATESINLAIRSFPGHVVSTTIEHDAVIAAVRERDHSLVDVDRSGIVAVDSIERAIRDDTGLLSVHLANNELGTIQPIKAISQLVQRINDERQTRGVDHKVYFHCDASQGFGQIDVHTARLGVDLLTLNAAKLYGPKQVALLWAKPSTPLKAQLVGGGQERGLRSGTENVAGTVGFARAAEIAAKHQKNDARRLQHLRDSMQHAFEEAFEGMRSNGHTRKRLPGALHVSFPGLDAERLVFALETQGVLLATGSACAANKGTRSHVLTAIGLSDEEADGSLRLTLGRLNDEVGVQSATQIIIDTVTAEYARIKK